VLGKETYIFVSKGTRGMGSFVEMIDQVMDGLKIGNQ